MSEKTTIKIEGLLKELTKNEYLTAETIAENLGVSTKTARSRMIELNSLVLKRGAEIISRPRYGFHLQINDPLKWDEYLRSRSLIREVEAGTPEERTSYIALKLLLAGDYIKINQFADELYVSAQIISDVLKDCERLFQDYKLLLKRKPYCGLKVTGSEFDRRNCIVNRFPNEFKSFLPENADKEDISKTVFEVVVETLIHHRIHLADISLQSTAAYVYLSIIRCKLGYVIKDETSLEKNYMKDRAFAAAADIIYKLCPEMDDAEVYHLGIYISAMRSNDIPEFQTNIVITQKIDQLVNKIFDAINRVFGVDFRNDLRLHMMLAQHLISLDLRIRYHIPLNSDIYLNIRKNFAYAYTIANEALAVLAQEYGVKVSESESDWLALIFATGLHDIQANQKMNVLVVCQEGRASSQLLRYEILKNYGSYINNVSVCTVYELEHYDLSDIDYIFSTVNITIRTNVPILMVYNFSLFQKDNAIENELLSHRVSTMDKFFSKEMFFTGIKGTTKEEILSSLCEKIAEKDTLPDGFYEALMDRERALSTDYSPLVAIPHPASLIPDHDIVAVAILDKPIHWGRYNVQVLVLTALTMSDEESTQFFYQVTSHFVTDKKNISQLIKAPTFETFISIISTIELS